MSKPSFVYVIYIASTPEKVFAALTDARMSERYWFGNHVESDWKAGSPFALKRGEKKMCTGTVLESDPPRRLSYTFQSLKDEMPNENPTRVTFEIERQEDQVKLTVMHDGFVPGSKVFESISEGWPLMLSSFKSFLEGGRVLRALWYEEAIRREQEAQAQQ